MINMLFMLFIFGNQPFHFLCWSQMCICCLQLCMQCTWHNSAVLLEQIAVNFGMW